MAVGEATLSVPVTRLNGAGEGPDAAGGVRLAARVRIAQDTLEPSTVQQRPPERTAGRPTPDPLAGHRTALIAPPVAIDTTQQGLRIARIGNGEPLPALAAPGAPRDGDVPGLSQGAPRDGELNIGAFATDLAARLNERTARMRDARALLDTPGAGLPLSEGLDESPRTWAMGLDGTDVARAYAVGLLRVGAREGVNVQVSASNAELLRLRPALPSTENLRTFPQAAAPWLEDTSSVSRDGTTTLTPALGSFAANRDDSKPTEQALTLQLAQMRERISRTHPGEAIPPLQTAADMQVALSRYPDLNFNMQGAVAEDGTMVVAAARTLAARGALRIGDAYLEGGNVLTGRRADGTPYAIVGSDTVGINRAILPDQPAGPLSTTEVERLVARDIGVPHRDLVPVTQPGAFHIDMAMTPWERGSVVVNDARLALQAQAEAMRASVEAQRPRVPPAGDRRALQRYAAAARAWTTASATVERQITGMTTTARGRAQLEDRAAAELERAGLTVIRAPGRFMNPEDPRDDVANLLNGEGGRGHTGQFFATAGAPPWAEQAFLRAVSPHTRASTTVYFVTSPADAAASLRLGGSLNCRVKRLE